jgi:hypothetical protein
LEEISILNIALSTDSMEVALESRKTPRKRILPSLSVFASVVGSLSAPEPAKISGSFLLLVLLILGSFFAGRAGLREEDEAAAEATSIFAAAEAAAVAAASSRN